MDDLRAYPTLCEYLQQDHMFFTAINDMGLFHSAPHGFHTTVDFGYHAVLNGAIIY